MANKIPKIEYNNGVTDVTIEFEYPPQGLDFEGRNYRAVQKVSESTSGKYQTSQNYLEDERNLRFRQVKEAIKTELDTFFLTHALLGKSFKYFIDKDEVAFDTVKLSKRGRRYRPQRTGWNSNNELTYQIRMRLRQVI